MRTHLVPGLSICLLAAGSPVAAMAAPGNPAAGAKLFASTGCSGCHGERGQGTPDAPRLSAATLTEIQFTSKVRQPANRMPAYTRIMVSDQGLADIYAFLKAGPARRK